jgi:hypothetical protein
MAQTLSSDETLEVMYNNRMHMVLQCLCINRVQYMHIRASTYGINHLSITLHITHCQNMTYGMLKCVLHLCDIYNVVAPIASIVFLILLVQIISVTMYIISRIVIA